MERDLFSPIKLLVVLQQIDTLVDGLAQWRIAAGGQLRRRKSIGSGEVAKRVHLAAEAHHGQIDLLGDRRLARQTVLVGDQTCVELFDRFT